MSASAGPPELVGREDQLTLLDRLAADLGRGRGRVLWIEGEPGIGKSALVDALQARAPAGSTVLRSAAEDLTRAFPLRSMARALGIRGATDPARVEIAGLLGVHATAGVLDPVLAAGERMLELVDRLCAESALVLVLEDLQWADEPSLTLWGRLAGSVDQLPLLLAGTRRPVPARAELDALRADVQAAGAQVLDLQPLTGRQVGVLAGRLIGADPDPGLLAALGPAGGNPLYVRELIAALRGPERTQRPASLTAAIRRRLDALGAGPRDVLRLAAVLGGDFDVLELAAANGRTPADVVPALETAVAAGILVPAGPRLAFRHGVIRGVLVEDTAEPLQAALHSQFARTLAQAGASVGAVAPHLLAGATTVEPWVGRWLAGLPESTLYAAPLVSVQLLERAVRAPGAADRWGSLAGRLAALYLTTGRDEDAVRLAGEVVRTVADPDLLGRMLLLRIRVSSRRNLNELGLSEAAAALADDRVPPVWAARIRGRRAVLLVKEDRPEEAREEAGHVLSAATDVADPIGSGTAHLVLAQLSGDADALAHLDAGLAGLGADPEAMDLRLLLLNNRLAALNNLGRGPEFRTAAEEALILADQAGSARDGWLLGAAAMGEYDFGAWDEAQAHLDSIQPPQPVSVLMTRAGLAALIAGHREDWPRLREHVAAGSALPMTGGDTRIVSGYLVAARALRAEADGDPGRAVDALAGWLDPALGYEAGERYMWLPDLVRVALAAGRRDTAEAAAAASDADAAGPDARLRQLAAAEFCRAQLHDDVVALDRVAATGARYGWPLLQAAAAEEAAVRMASADAAGARARLGEAVRLYTGLGASWNVRRADARLRGQGIRRGPRSLHRRAATGWAALTPTEQRVAELVAAGHSNPDIAAELLISRRTAQTHVSHILRKLDLTSRSEVRTVAG